MPGRQAKAEKQGWDYIREGTDVYAGWEWRWGTGGLSRALKQVRMGHMDIYRKQADWIQLPDLSVITCVSLRKSPNFFTPQFHHL